MVVCDGVGRFSGDQAPGGLHQYGGVAGDEEGGEQRGVAVEGRVAFELAGEGLLEAGGDLPGAGDQCGGGRDGSEEVGSADGVLIAGSAFVDPFVQRVGLDRAGSGRSGGVSALRPRDFERLVGDARGVG
ncbi:hypothetical protein ACIBQ1_48535 [Nonomuraea sp. NPDC050153]|uniref:hypothetical protein n=1 Tax=Nonomuraea sp. NPDC050153 TaxID=3364359 RepID=UPI0037BD9DCF